MSDPVTPSRRDAMAAAGLTAVGLTAGTVRADDEKSNELDSNKMNPQPKLVENSYPLANDEARTKTVKVCQQATVDLLALFNFYKQAHWNLNGPLYLVLHEYYQETANYYRKQADVFAERVLHMGYSVDGRYSTIAKTASLSDFPSGYDTDTETLRMLIERVTAFQKEVYKSIKATEESDPPTSNKFQDLAYAVDKNLWQLRIHLAKPGGTGDALPYSAQQGRVRGK